jgi:hypothetical protein
MISTQGGRRRSVTTDEEFFKFINSTSPDERVFFMGDNLETRKMYEQKFPNKLLFYSEFLKDESSIAIGGRHTPISYAITEMFIAAHSYNFQGTVGSSFSELVAIYSDIFTTTRVCHRLSLRLRKQDNVITDKFYFMNNYV